MHTWPWGVTVAPELKHVDVYKGAELCSAPWSPRVKEIPGLLLPPIFQEKTEIMVFM